MTSVLTTEAEVGVMHLQAEEHQGLWVTLNLECQLLLPASFRVPLQPVNVGDESAEEADDSPFRAPPQPRGPTKTNVSFFQAGMLAPKQERVKNDLSM